MATLSTLAPALAARVAERLFLSAPRHPAPARETAVLAGARTTIVRVDGAPVTTWTWGHGPRILLVHGWGGRGAQLAGFVGPLVASGCSVVTFDAPGHGSSPQARSSIVAFLAAIQAIDRTLGPVRGIVAHSIGTVAAARALRDGLHAAAAVFIAPPADLVLQSHTRLEALGFGRQARELMQARIERQLGEEQAAYYRVTPRARAAVQDGAIIARGWPGAVLSTTGGLGHRRILRDPYIIRVATAFVTEHLPGVLVAAWDEAITASSMA